jgi:ketosteroid isomerase-like protein
MKSCPSCHSNYTDDSLTYCLQDGNKLIAEQVSETEYPTVAFGDKTERFSTNKEVHQIQFDLPQNAQTARNQSFETQIASVQTPDRKSKTLVVALSTALGMLILFGAVGIGTWFYFSKDQPAVVSDLNKNSNEVNAVNSKSNSSNNSTPNKNSTPKTSPSLSATPKIDIREEETTIAADVNAWKSASEAHDLEAHMDYYADKVDYYNRRQVGKSQVRSDRQKAYDKYPVIKITLGKINVFADSSGEFLTAVFDKEWLFQNDQKQSSGKVKTELKFSKINGQWKITSEKDLKVYFVN